ncbi:MAG: hypothetical protein IJY47_07615 [Clostridia bacterium]|nr:hypothetical protein [Clostridia bacterium]
MEYEFKHYCRVKFALVLARNSFLKELQKDEYENYAREVIDRVYFLVLNKIDGLDGTNERLVNIARRMLKSTPKCDIINSERRWRYEKNISIIVSMTLLCFSICLCACQTSTLQNNENTQDLFEENNHTTVSSSISGQTNDDRVIFPEWKTAYLDFIERRESEYAFDYRYALVYVDNDNIPELYAMGTCEADGDLICSYKNGRIIEQRLGRMLGGKYVEQSGTIMNQNGHMGQYYDNVYKLDENGFSQILNASYTERYVSLENDEFEIIKEYFIDGNPTTKDQYNVAINSCFDLSQAVEFYDAAVSYTVIKQQIQDCK